MNKKFKVLGINHIAFATSDISKTERIFSNILGMQKSHIEDVKSEKVKVLKLFAENNSTKIELLEPLTDDSTIKKFLIKRGDSLHHIALEVDDIYNAIDCLIEKKIKLIYNKPKIGAGNKLITFIHPQMTPGLLIELCQCK